VESEINFSGITRRPSILVLSQSLGIENTLSGVRAVLARELVSRGYSQKEIASTICTSPAAVTLYTKGKRGNELSRMIRSDKNAGVVVENLIDRLLQIETKNGTGKGHSSDAFPLILDAAYRIMQIVSSSPTIEKKIPVTTEHPEPPEDALIERLRQEELAAQRNMALAVGTSDEVARTIFRQIASDSIRHSEIISFLISRNFGPLKKGKRSKKTIENEIDQIELMLKEEENATEEPIKLNAKSIDPSLALLLKSIDLDEEKHRMLLSGLLKTGKKKLSLEE
jgi:uncharacterized protein